MKRHSTPNFPPAGTSHLSRRTRVRGGVMRTIILALAVATVPAMALTGDSFVLPAGTTASALASTGELEDFEAKMRERSEPALFARIDGKDYVISDRAAVERAREIFARKVPIKAEKRALKQERRALMQRQRQMELRGSDEAEAAEL